MILTGGRTPAPVRSHWVYILKCADGTLYTGSTVDVQRRLRQHNSGRGSKYTRSRLPVLVAYEEQVGTLREALRRENEIKRLSRSAKLLICAAYSKGRGTASASLA
ncbi:MAG: GIY-YIG nuclease family protein [Thaumarchaeota archaeon]|nr:GIY-YIG nuclease family protein [Nitrososphaerota archaeon]